MNKNDCVKDKKHTFKKANYLIREYLFRQLLKLFKQRYKRANKRAVDVLRFEISSDKINYLLSTHQLCAADVRCLDVNSKKCLKKLCLQACLQNGLKNSRLARGI